MRLVSEIGVNWDGDFELVKEMMQESVNAGFNLVKFQSFEAKLVADHPQASRVFRSSVTPENIERAQVMFDELVGDGENILTKAKLAVDQFLKIS